jgi:hypothetical protein
MATSAKPDPKIVMVPVKRYDIELSIEDIMTPLTAFANKANVGQAIATSPEVQPHAAKLSDLAQQVLDVAKRIQAINPDILSPKPGSR